MPGAEHMRLIMTGILGIVGPSSGDWSAACSASLQRATPFHPAGIIMSLIDALIVLLIYGKAMS